MSTFFASDDYLNDLVWGLFLLVIISILIEALVEWWRKR
jgi:uncharacterized iron-regulated membrane protein